MPALLALLAEVCGDDRAQLARALAGVRAYQAHPYGRALPARPENARIGAVALRDYGGGGPPVVFVPSLINPPTVLDLAEGNSLLRWLSGQGVRPLLVDWGTPGDAELSLGLGGMVTERLVPLIAALGEPVALAGYCMGGTLALAAAASLPVTRLALLAAPWRFDGYDDGQRAAVAAHAAAIRPLVETLGCVPMDLLQPMFWALDRDAVAAKFAAFAALDPNSGTAQAFVALEDWANDGPPLPLRVATELFDDLYAANLSGLDDWVVGEDIIRPEALRMPILDIVARRDRIVPPASALGLGTRLDLDAGHVGMIVGSRARGLLWEPLARFLRGD